MAEERKQDEEPKQVLERGIKGKVKWYNVRRGYGFVCRTDTGEDLFIHRSAIAKNNPQKARKSVGENEEIEFDVVSGEKGKEASNVTGPGGAPVQGSDYAPNLGRGGRRFYRGGALGGRGGQQGGGDRYRTTSDSSRGRGGPFRGRGRGGRFYNVQYRRPPLPYYDEPYLEMQPYYGGYYRGGPPVMRRGRGGYGPAPYMDDGGYDFRGPPVPTRGGRVFYGGRGGGRGSGGRGGGRRRRTESGRSVGSNASRGRRRRNKSKNSERGNGPAEDAGGQ